MKKIHQKHNYSHDLAYLKEIAKLLKFQIWQKTP